MSKEKKKVYVSGDQINLRLSKSRVTQDVIDAINEASNKNKVNEFAMTALEFYVRYRNNNMDIISDKEFKNDSSIKNTKRVELIKESEFNKDEKVKSIKENEKNNAEDEVFGNNGSLQREKKGLNGSFSALRRQR